jgi:hypothetical protein
MQPFDLRTAVESQPWEWLVDLSRRLHVAIEILGEDFVPMLSAGTGSGVSELHHLLAAESSPLRSNISDLTESSPRAVSVDGNVCVCFALRPTGVLVVARQATRNGRDDAEAWHRNLELIGSWLVRAIEAHLAGPPGAAAAEPHVITSLQRMLSGAVSRGSVRGAVAAFVETLAVWLDIDVRGYAADGADRLLLSMVPVGANPSATPAELDAAAVPDRRGIVRLTPDEAERLGFASVAPDVLIRRISTQSGASWLMVFTGIINADGEPRLTVYSELLEASLKELTAPPAGSTMVRLPSRVNERRLQHRPFQAWIERLVAQAVQDGGRASLIIISMPDMESHPSFMHAQVGRIRNELRPSDFVGSITAGEIAVLLRDTAPDGAAVISDRLEKLLQSELGTGQIGLPSVGMISCSAESPFEGSFVAAAREACAANSRLG